MSEFDDQLSNVPIVIDNGSGIIKAGFAGTDKPKIDFPSYVGRPKHVRCMASADDRDYYIGSQAQKLRGILWINYPIEHGIVTDWTDMQNIWQHTYEELRILTDEHPVLLTEAPLNPRHNRAKAANIFFETFNVPSLYVGAQAILSLYASGRTTGVVLDSGDGVTHAVPVYEGFALPHAITRIDVAGRDVTRRLQLLLRKSGYNFHTSAEFEVIKEIKQSCCFVAFDLEKCEQDEKEKDEDEKENIYRLPDGAKIKIGPEKFRSPEVLFKPEELGLEYPGIHECLFQSVQKSDLDIRRTLYSEIVLAGGSTKFTGFGDRLLCEMRALAPRDTNIRIMAPQDRIYSTWLGGSILASLKTFKSMCITRKEYQEYGSNILQKKMF